MRSSAFDFCIKCNNGGKLLVCKGNDCPIIVHEKCMGSPANYDVAGNFHCPYCLSGEAYVELNLAREAARLKKRALSSFIDAKVIDCNKEEEISGNTKRKRKYPLGETGNVKISDHLHKENNPHNYKTSTDQVNGDKQGAPEVRSASLCRGHDGSSLPDQNDVSTYRQGNTSKTIDSIHNQPFEVNDVGRTGEDKVHRSSDDLANLSGSSSVQEKPSEGEKDDSKSSEENENNHGETASPGENNSILDVRLGADGLGETTSKISRECNCLLRKSKRIKVSGPCEPPSLDVDCSGRSSPIMSKNPRKTKKTVAPSKVNSHCEPPSSNVDCSGRSSPIVRKSPRKTKQTVAPSKVNSPSEPPSSNVDYSGRSPPIMRKSPRKTNKTNIPSEVSQKILHPGPRRKLFWTAEEEEMIKKGVEKYTSKDNKNIPWRNILEYGLHVFHCSRMPGHLKDKWRKMLDK